MTEFISNDEFKYLNNDDREKLKKDYKNYIYRNDKFYHYVQDINEYYFKQHLLEIEKMHLGNIVIYMNDKLGKELKLIKDNSSLELF